MKSPAPNEFRSQSEFGGSTRLYHPSEQVLKTAKDILDQYDYPLLYARVDGIIQDGRFVLMELELIEPLLFLDRVDWAYDRFADAFCQIAGRL